VFAIFFSFQRGCSLHHDTGGFQPFGVTLAMDDETFFPLFPLFALPSFYILASFAILFDTFC
jgi:hypothetical protein